MVNAPHPATYLSRKEAFFLLKDLLHGFSSAEFQTHLKELLKNKSTSGHVPGRSELALTVQSKVLPKYGLPGTEQGVNDMFEIILPMLGDSLIYQMMVLIEDKIGMHAETTLDKLMRFFRKAPRPDAKDSEKLSASDLLAVKQDVLDSLRAPAFQKKLQTLNPDNVKNRVRLALLQQNKVVKKTHNIDEIDNIFVLFDAYWRNMEIPEADVVNLMVEMQEVLGVPDGTPLDELMTVSLAMTKGEVLSITKQLLERFSTPDFQEALHKLSADDVDGRRKLALTVQKKILPKYGIPGTPDGVEFMHAAIAPYMDDWMLFVEGTMLNTMLREMEARIDSEQKLPALLDISRPKTTVIRTEMLPVVLTKDQAFRMAWDILESYSDADFQLQLQKLISSKPVGQAMGMRPKVKTPNHIPGRSKLVAKVLSQVLPKYGVMDQQSSIYDGEKKTVQAFSPFKDDWMLQAMLWAGNLQLGKSTSTTLQWLLTFFRRNPQSAVQVSLTKFEVLSISKELLQGFSASEFQLKMEPLLAKGENAYDMPSRTELALSVLREVLPKYGLSGRYEGVAVMLEAMLPYTDDDVVQQLHFRLLGLISPFLPDWVQLMDDFELEEMIGMVDDRLEQSKEADETEDQFTLLDDPSLSKLEEKGHDWNRQLSNASTTCSFSTTSSFDRQTSSDGFLEASLSR